MDRLTKRVDDIVYMQKDGELLAPVALSGQEVRQVLQKLADYEDGRHGKWERTDITTDDGWALYRCNCCNWHTTYYYSFSASPTYNFCPNCGAKMGL